MMNLLPVGSIIDKEGILLLIIGYDLYVINHKFQIGYLVTVYPIGIADENSIMTLDIESDYQCIFRGYQNKNSEVYIKHKSDLFKEIKNQNPLELLSYYDDLYKYIRAKSEDKNNE